MIPVRTRCDGWLVTNRQCLMDYPTLLMYIGLSEYDLEDLQSELFDGT